MIPCQHHSCVQKVPCLKQPRHMEEDVFEHAVINGSCEDGELMQGVLRKSLYNTVSLNMRED